MKPPVARAVLDSVHAKRGKQGYSYLTLIMRGAYLLNHLIGNGTDDQYRASGVETRCRPTEEPARR
jgi:hypothetical protein